MRRPLWPNHSTKGASTSREKALWLSSELRRRHCDVSLVRCLVRITSVATEATTAATQTAARPSVVREAGGTEATSYFTTSRTDCLRCAGAFFWTWLLHMLPLLHSTSLSRHWTQGHCDSTTTCAASQGAASCLVPCLLSQSMRMLHVAGTPCSTHSMEQPRSALVVTDVVVSTSVVVVGGRVVVSVSVFVVVGKSLGAARTSSVVVVLVLVLVAVLVVVWVTVEEVPVVELVVRVVLVAVVEVCVVDVAVVDVAVIELVDDVVDIVVDVVLIEVVLEELVAVVVVRVVEVLVSVNVDGQPRCSFSQHHTFQSGVQSVSQFSYSNWQLYSFN